MIEFDFDAEDQFSEDIKDSVKDLGYETRNSFINLTTVMLVIFIYYIKVIIAGLLKIAIHLTDG